MAVSARRGKGLIVVVVAFAATALVGCSNTSGTPVGLDGESIEVLAVWAGAEQRRFEAVLAAFEKDTGVDVTYTSVGHNVAEALTERIGAGSPPDVAILPQPGLLRRFVKEGVLVALDDSVERAVADNYPHVWRELGSVDGRLYGVWFKAANKSLIWYRIAAFEDAGVVPPEDLDGLLELAAHFENQGLRAFAVAGGDAWTLTDLFENLYLRNAGLTNYDRLADHAIPWTDQSVKDTLALMSMVLPTPRNDPDPTLLATKFEGAVQQVFGGSPSAAMIAEGDFVAGIVSGATDAQLGIDADVFAFPSYAGSGAGIVGGGDAAVLLRDGAAGMALLRYLATPEAAAIWAEAGGFISPNMNVDLSVYPDDITRSVARRLLEAGDEFRFDLSDMQPAQFGAIAQRGMRKLLQDFLVTRDVEATALRLEAEAAEAFAP